MQKVQKSLRPEVSGEETDLTSFVTTKPLPTYLFTIICGEFEEIVCPPEQLLRDISMSIYCRKTLL